MSVVLGNGECSCKAAEEWQKCVGKCLGNTFRPFSFKHSLLGIPLEVAFCPCPDKFVHDLVVRGCNGSVDAAKVPS